MKQKQILFIQGGGEGTYDEWDSKLVNSLRSELGAEYEVLYPRMPNETDPAYEAWKVAIGTAIDDLSDGAVVIGHSIGATILIDVLAQTSPERKLAGVVLIAAPFIGDGGWPSEEVDPMHDLGTRLHTTTPIYLFHGSEDDIAPLAHVDLYEQAIPGAVVHRLDGRDHQLNDDMSEVAAGIRALT